MTGAGNICNAAPPPSPHTLFEHLNGEIVGHYVMKKALSVAIYNHLCNVSLSRYVEAREVRGK
jgi:ATP-dependent protease Clp ATPase subunit